LTKISSIPVIQNKHLQEKTFKVLLLCVKL